VPPALSAKDLPGGRNQVLNERRIKNIDLHPAASGEDGAPESISDTEYWLDWNWELDHPNDSEDNWERNNESEIVPDKGIDHLETPEQRDVSA